MSSKINVLHLRSSSGFGGGEQVILTICKNLNKEKFQPFVACFTEKKGTEKALLERAQFFNIPTILIRTKRRLDIKGIIQLRNYLRELNIKIVHSHDFKSNLYALLSCIGSKVKCVSTMHGIIIPFSLKFKFTIWINDHILNLFFDRIIAVADHIAEGVRRCGVPAKKIVTIYNGLDETLMPQEFKTNNEPLYFPSDGYIVATITRLYPSKGNKYLIEAAKEIVKNYRQIYFFIVGDGPSKTELEEQVKNLSLTENVIFTGHRNDVKEILEKINLFVLPSLQEGTPMIVMEAMALGKPIIATDIPGVNRLIENNITGILVPPADSIRLAEAILYLYRNPDFANKLGEQAKKVFKEKFTAEQMVRKTEQLYEELVKN